MTLRSLPAASVLFLCATPAWSKAPPATAAAVQVAAPTESKATQAEPKATKVQSQTAPTAVSVQTPAPASPDAAPLEIPPGDARVVDYDQRRRAALVSYKVGEIDTALAELRELTAGCEEQGTACSDSTRAELYVALAIVLAGGKEDIKGAARLFHAALTRDPAVTVPRELATLPVQEAMRLANESTSYKELSPAAESAEVAPNKTETDWGDAPPEDEDEDEDEDDSPNHQKTGLLLVHGLLGGGADELSEAPAYGAAAILGARFVDASAWTTAIRGRVAIVGVSQEPVAGASLVMGGAWQNSRRNTMGYFLGGLGLDSYGGEGGVSVNAMGGVTMGGFLLGGGIDMGASDYGSFLMMCLHLGWGARL